MRDGGLAIGVASQHATRIEFCLFDGAGDKEVQRVPLTPDGKGCHAAFIPGIKPGARYGLRATGPWAPERGHRFDPAKLLVDPYATSLDRPYMYHPQLCEKGRDTAGLVPKAIVQLPLSPVKRTEPRQPTWIYELSVKAFTKLNPDIPERLRGTVAALAHPAALAHFKRLGVDTIELMPLAAWIDERHLHALNLGNAWGYNPITFMAPDPRLAPGGFAEIADTVRVLHDHGLQVILDVVLNHTGESDVAGPTLSFRGLDHATYYAQAGGSLINDTGCGNTLALNHPQVTDYCLTALRHWVEATGIDGFRFDLASVMGRLPEGFSRDAPLIARIEQDPVLLQSILIAEPWDVGPGGYQLGNFPKRWLEWNDRFRDDVRRFWRCDRFSVNRLATRLAGSSDVFGPAKSPSRSVNFVAAHDGFTLADLTRFDTKHNLANGEGNRDGKADEVTVVGQKPTALLACLFLARGTPMLTAGDEFGRSQQGNNNAYAQDNALTWLDWNAADQKLISLVAVLVQLRAQNPLLRLDAFLTGKSDGQWFDATGKTPDWNSGSARVLGLVLSDGTERLAILCNGSEETVALPLPARSKMAWRMVFPGAAGADVPSGEVGLYREEKA